MGDSYRNLIADGLAEPLVKWPLKKWIYVLYFYDFGKIKFERFISDYCLDFQLQ